jgi:hypothetical protein
VPGVGIFVDDTLRADVDVDALPDSKQRGAGHGGKSQRGQNRFAGEEAPSFFA